MPTKAQKQYMDMVASFGCIVCWNLGHSDTPAMVHHTLTGGGGRRDDDMILGLCHLHHQGRDGIHTIGRKKWHAEYGTETELMQQTKELLGVKDE